MERSNYMNILFTLRFFPVYGGGETVTIRLAEKFSSDGHNVNVFYLWDNGEYELDSNITKFRVPNIGSPLGKEKIRKEDYAIINESLSNYIINNKIEFIINQ